MTIAPSVAVCVVTYRRPHGLKRLLRALAELRFRAVGPPRYAIVVVDNDPAGSAGAECDVSDHGVPVVYVHEPRRGIPVARNAAVRAARRLGSEFIAFIDDDEEPAAFWLDELLRVQEQCGADIVSGPVDPVFEGDSPEWIRGFFARRRYATGAHPSFGATNNVLVRTSAFTAGDRPFDERLALSGGEDTLFFLQAAKAGHRHVWADDAMVAETIGPSRARAVWLMRRSFRKGSTLAFCERVVDGSLHVRVRRATRATGQIAIGLASLPVAAVRGRVPALRAVLRVCQGAGGLAGLAGLLYREYHVTHGS